MEYRKLLSWIVFLTFLLMSAVGMIFHEIWLDEAQHFLIARDSSNFTQLMLACRIEGHPLMWDSMLFILTRFTHKVIFMQLMHVMISLVTVGIILKTRLNFAEKILIIFSYFIFFEYNIISRNYGISALFMILIIYCYQKTPANVLLLSSIIFLLAQTHLFSLIFSISFVIVWILQHRKDLKNIHQLRKIISLFIIFSGWIIALYSIIPPLDYGQKFLGFDASAYLSDERILKTISVCLKGIFYIPDYRAPKHHFMNTLWYGSMEFPLWAVYIMSFISILIPVVVLRKNKFASALFISFLTLFSSVYFFLPLIYGIRYFGFFFITFICCFIIARRELTYPARIICIIIFTAQAINGAYAYAMDIRYPFSESKNVSSFLEEPARAKENVYILNPTLRPAISAYTGRKYFGVENGKQLSYCLWDQKLADSVLKRKLNSALMADSCSIIISNNPFYGIIDTTRLEKLAVFESGILAGENAVIWRVIK